ncbi:NAD(P)-dependent oxidoreductase [Halobacillus litoralis]|uniref:NAD(P)-dependent oxidoreductase n=1 Tax=Halobacillus litoralis TaxID=45668 RepID=UPI001CD272D7|nr:NAD(P)-dependent oxidoreductase [Halobacillus litoralis]MCA0971210.1 NAD(P)-dependent oxidoreductase [Halobacillus litoralis]
MEKPVIGLVGTGVMGKSMARNLMQAGYTLNIFTRTKEKAEELLKEGANWQSSVRTLAEQSDVILTIVGYPEDVESVYFDDEGILQHARPGTYLIDMTTSSPKLAERISMAAQEKSLHALDAPVSGGDVGAKNGTLSIMVGGDDADFASVLPVFEVMGGNIVLQGPAGAGQHTKLCNQIAIAAGMMGVVEAVLYAEQAGLDPHRVLQSIESGAAGSWSLSNLAPRMIAGNFAPGFYVKHFIKDMKLAIESAEQLNVPVPGLTLAKQLYDKLSENGGDNDGTQALYKYYKMTMSPNH